MMNLFGKGAQMGRMNVNASDSVHTKFLIGIGLSILALAGYWGVTGNGFINYDDQAYVTWNRHVQNGLTLEEIVWAFTTSSVSNWHPLTWLSLMLDRELYGMNAGGYHWTSVVLHLASGQQMKIFRLLPLAFIDLQSRAKAITPGSRFHEIIHSRR